MNYKPHLSRDEARQGERKKGMPSVLVISVIAVVLLMAAGFVFMR